MAGFFADRQLANNKCFELCSWHLAASAQCLAVTFRLMSSLARYGRTSAIATVRAVAPISARPFRRLDPRWPNRRSLLVFSSGLIAILASSTL